MKTCFWNKRTTNSKTKSRKSNTSSIFLASRTKKTQMDTVLDTISDFLTLRLWWLRRLSNISKTKTLSDKKNLSESRPNSWLSEPRWWTARLSTRLKKTLKSDKTSFRKRLLHRNCSRCQCSLDFCSSICLSISKDTRMISKSRTFGSSNNFSVKHQVGRANITLRCWLRFFSSNRFRMQKIWNLKTKCKNSKKRKEASCYQKWNWYKSKFVSTRNNRCKRTLTQLRNNWKKRPKTSLLENSLMKCSEIEETQLFQSKENHLDNEWYDPCLINNRLKFYNQL